MDKLPIQASSLPNVVVSPARLLSPEEVNDFMWLSDTAKNLLSIYLKRIDDQENPAVGTLKGYTATELDAMRTVAHNQLLRQLAQEGIDTSDRGAITEMARRYERWCREEME